MKYYLTFDVGGTEIKCNIVNQNGSFCFQETISYSAKSNCSKEIIMKNFVYIIESLIEQIDDPRKVIEGIGFAFPGPFDYENGICFIRGLGKYENLYGVNIRDELMKMLRETPTTQPILSKECKIIFENDAKLFALGETKFGEGKIFQRIACFTIGTGCGSAFINKGMIVKGEAGIPESGMIYSQPFRNSIIDDYISVRGLNQITLKYFEKNYTGRELFELASKGNMNAQKVFVEFGEIIGSALSVYIQSFQADAVIFGGQISKSYHFFKENFVKHLNKYVEVRISKDTSTSTMYGIYSLLIE